MAKRFTATEIWNEDWFLDMPIEYKLFWYYMLANCDHAGLFKLNLRSFCGLNEVKMTSNKALEYFNTGKQRIRVVSESIWFIEDFFVYQYGVVFNWNNRVHDSIGKLYLRHKINLTSIRGLLDLKEGVKDKDKDKDKDIITMDTKSKKIEKEIFGKEFTEDRKYVILTNGQMQELGKNQKLQLSFDSLNPEDVYKNYIQ